MAGLSGEFPAALEKWTFDNLPISYVQGERQARNVLRESNLNYTILRLTWLYNDPENTNYELIPEGAQFNDAQVTREAVVKAIFDILHAEDETPFHRTS
ncbi:NAD(P)H-binding protein, partial [Veillonella sp.]